MQTKKEDEQMMIPCAYCHQEYIEVRNEDAYEDCDSICTECRKNIVKGR